MDIIHQYASAKAAAARYARLRDNLPGSVQGIDYEALHMSMCSNSPGEAAQEVALDNLDELISIQLAFRRARARCKVAHWYAWWCIRVDGHTAREMSEMLGVVERTIYRRLSRTDSIVMDELIERDLVRGSGGRDLIEAGGPQSKGVQVYADEVALALAQGGEE